MLHDFYQHRNRLLVHLFSGKLPKASFFYTTTGGTLKAKFKVGGTPMKPNFNGTMSIEDCSFLFVPNNMYYKLEGKFQPEGERINIVMATIRNVDADNKSGRRGALNVTGGFAFRELVPSDFNLSSSGQLLVVNKNTLTSSLSVYGELPVEIAQGNLKFTGNLGNLLLKGSPLVRNSSLAFPPTTASAEADTFFIPFKVVDDTTKAVEQREQPIVTRYFRSVLQQRDSLGGKSNEAIRTPSFIDGLRYDLNVEFAGSNNEVRMIFNPATNEELVAYITGKAAIT
jgi:autotransporter translocation and assembly factor TamB